jgi:hypothetical protein
MAPGGLGEREKILAPGAQKMIALNTAGGYSRLHLQRESPRQSRGLD